MSGRFVRASAFRHVFGEVPKDTDCYCDLKPMASGDGDFVKANNKYYAVGVTGGGGPLQIGSLENTGRLGNQPKLTVHKAKVLDFDFHPFIPEMIATASEDCYAMVTKFPVGGITKETTGGKNVTTCDVKLEGHQKKVNFAKFHPTAMNILATTSFDHTVKVWDIEAQSEVFNFEGHGDAPTSFDWNTDGSLALTTCKDKQIRIFDPRTAESAQECKGFEGAKKPVAVWVDNHQKFAAVGFSKSSSRAYGLWDPRNLAAGPVNTTDIDQSAGQFMIRYDPDNSVLYLAGKGDSSVKYFEITDEEPFAYFLSEFRHGESTKGIGWLPKRDLNTGKCEVMRALRLLRDKIQPVSFQVPRKSEMFQADIFPDTYAGESTLSSADYIAGKNAAPATVSMNPKNRGGETKTVEFTAKKSPAELQAELTTALARIKELEAEVAKLKA